MSVEVALKRMVEKGVVPTDFQVTYDDMHGLWGGTTIVITGKGNGQRRERENGGADPKEFERAITREQLLELAKLLVEQKAWEQRTPEREPLPDESRSRLKIEVDGQTSGMWEWFNDMEKNERLIKIQTKMKQMTQP